MEYKRNQLPEPLDQTTYPSIVDIAEKIHGHIVGSTTCWDKDDLELYYHWLMWRISDEGWQHNTKDRTWPNLYDRAVRQLCLVACNMYKTNRTNKYDS